MKKTTGLLVLFLLLSFKGSSQNQTWSGAKTLSPTFKLLNLTQSTVNTKLLTLDSAGRLQWSDRSTTIPTLDQVLEVGYIANRNLLLGQATGGNTSLFTKSYIVIDNGIGAKTTINPLSIGFTTSLGNKILLQAQTSVDANYTQSLQNKSGTIALLSDIVAQVPVSATVSGIVNNNGLQELGGADKLIRGVRIGKGAGTNNSLTTVLGEYGLEAATTGERNTAIGFGSQRTNITGSRNTSVGSGALYSVGSAYNDVTAVGEGALQFNSSNGNTAIGSSAGKFTSSGANNSTSTKSLFIGFNTRPKSTGGSNEIVIGQDAVGLGSNTVVLGNNDIHFTYLRGILNIALVPTYLDNIDALNNGLSVGDIYRTSVGILMIVY